MGLAEVGVEKWTMNTVALTVTYLDTSANPVLVARLSPTACVRLPLDERDLGARE